MRRYTHSLSLNEKEEQEYIKANKATGLGVKKIFMEGIKSVDGDKIAPDDLIETKGIEEE